VIETIGFAAMGEHRDEEPAVRHEPGVDARQQFAPVGHMLEHLDRNDAVVNLSRFKAVHVGGYDAEVSKAPFGRGLFNGAPLRGGVRHGRDARRWEALRHE
jgi:hypothetical protein